MIPSSWSGYAARCEAFANNFIQQNAKRQNKHEKKQINFYLYIAAFLRFFTVCAVG